MEQAVTCTVLDGADCDCHSVSGDGTDCALHSVGGNEADVTFTVLVVERPVTGTVLVVMEVLGLVLSKGV